MVKMSDASRRFLEKELPDLLVCDDPRDILGPLDDLIVLKGLTEDQKNSNAFGDEAQAVYDDIFDSNYDD